MAELSILSLGVALSRYSTIIPVAARRPSAGLADMHVSPLCSYLIAVIRLIGASSMRTTRLN